MKQNSTHTLPAFEAIPSALCSAKGWLGLGILSLALAGIYSVIVVLARTPKLTSLFPVNDIFHVSLVVHVDLSVLVWFLAFAGIAWSMLPAIISEKPWKNLTCFGTAARWCFGIGALMMAATPFVDPENAQPLMNNYIPVLTNNVFFVSLGLVLLGTVLAAIQAMCYYCPRSVFRIISADKATEERAILFGITSSAWIALLSIICMIATYFAFTVTIEGQEFYEILFWAGGHVLQFTHTQLLMVAWLWLLGGLGISVGVRPTTLFVLFGIGIIGVLATPLGYLEPVHSQEHREFFTQQMIWGNGAAAAILSIIVTRALIQTSTENFGRSALFTSLIMSIALFAVGGIFGEAINGPNVRIPAHYHGSIVGVTLAFMGVCYMILPRLGYTDMSQSRIAFWQPIVYGVGQLMHISGLAWSGGYGVLRKTPGELEGVLSKAKIAMGFMGLGGLLAIIGGLLFVIVIIRSYRSRPIL